MVGIGRFLTDVSGGDTVIVDGGEGVIIIDPDEDTLRRYEDKRAALLASPDRYEHLRDKPSVTRDDTPVHIRCSATSNWRRKRHCLERGAERRRPVPHRIPLLE